MWRQVFNHIINEIIPTNVNTAIKWRKFTPLKFPSYLSSCQSEILFIIISFQLYIELMRKLNDDRRTFLEKTKDIRIIFNLIKNFRNSIYAIYFQDENTLVCLSFFCPPLVVTCSHKIHVRDAKSIPYIYEIHAVLRFVWHGTAIWQCKRWKISRLQ